MLTRCGVPPDKSRTVLLSLEKLRKLEDSELLQQIEKELIDEGLVAKTMEEVRSFLKLRGDHVNVISELRNKYSQSSDDTLDRALNQSHNVFDHLNMNDGMYK